MKRGRIDFDGYFGHVTRRFGSSYGIDRGTEEGEVVERDRV